MLVNLLTMDIIVGVSNLMNIPDRKCILDKAGNLTATRNILVQHDKVLNSTPKIFLVNRIHQVVEIQSVPPVQLDQIQIAFPLQLLQQVECEPTNKHISLLHHVFKNPILRLRIVRCLQVWEIFTHQIDILRFIKMVVYDMTKIPHSDIFDQELMRRFRTFKQSLLSVYERTIFFSLVFWVFFFFCVCVCGEKTFFRKIPSTVLVSGEGGREWCISLCNFFSILFRFEMALGFKNG